MDRPRSPGVRLLLIPVPGVTSLVALTFGWTPSVRQVLIKAVSTGPEVNTVASPESQRKEGITHRLNLYPALSDLVLL